MRPRDLQCFHMEYIPCLIDLQLDHVTFLASKIWMKMCNILAEALRDWNRDSFFSLDCKRKDTNCRARADPQSLTGNKNNNKEKTFWLLKQWDFVLLCYNLKLTDTYLHMYFQLLWICDIFSYYKYTGCCLIFSIIVHIQVLDSSSYFFTLALCFLLTFSSY